MSISLIDYLNPQTDAGRSRVAIVARHLDDSILGAGEHADLDVLAYVVVMGVDVDPTAEDDDWEDALLENAAQGGLSYDAFVGSRADLVRALKRDGSCLTPDDYDLVDLGGGFKAWIILL